VPFAPQRLSERAADLLFIVDEQQCAAAWVHAPPTRRALWWASALSFAGGADRPT
jgi:hypothetical protein